MSADPKVAASLCNVAKVLSATQDLELSGNVVLGPFGQIEAPFVGRIV
jgi:hypothetical protein